VKNLNMLINGCTRTKTTDEIIDLCQKATIAISRVNTIAEVIEDVYVKEALLTATDPVTGTQIFMAPPPFMTPFLKDSGHRMTFPPRFGEHNDHIYGALGYSSEKLKELKQKEVI
jgi:crotonobetainyl-CoA:carnitine CoA-transferase CaiB-like acyl-CoA transferase